MSHAWEEPGWEEAFARLSPLATRFGFDAYSIDFSDMSIEKMTWLADKFEERERAQSRSAMPELDVMTLPRSGASSCP